MRRGVGLWSRLSFGAQVAAAVALAFGGAVLAIDLADWRYARVDLSASGRNTLDPEIRDVIDRLPGPVEIDVFFRPLESLYRPVSLEAQSSALDLLMTARNSRRDRIRVEVHDPAAYAAMQDRLRELGVEGENLVVVSRGKRKSVLRLFGDLVDVDWGNPSEAGVRYLTERGIPGVVNPRSWNPDPRAFRPARVSSFRVGESLAEALLKVSSETAPRVYVSSGHGEPGLEGTLSGDLSRLRLALEREGFEVLPWDPAQAPSVPDDCAVLAMIGADQPFRAAELEEVRSYVRGGGRLFAVPSDEDFDEAFEHGIGSLLSSLGIVPQAGIVCEAIVGRDGQENEGLPECSLILVGEGGFNASHPITEPLRRHGRRVQFAQARSFRSGATPAGTVPLPLVWASVDSWRDMPRADGVYDYARGPADPSGRSARPALAMAAEFPAGEAPEQSEGASGPGRRRAARVVAVASAGFVGYSYFPVNRDLVQNAFNWLAERDHRVRVSPRERGVSALDLERGALLARLGYVLWLGLPGICMAVGVGVAWKRRR